MAQRLETPPAAPVTAEAAVVACIRMAQRDGLHFVARVGQFALESATLDDLEREATSMYRLALEHGHPFLPDLANRVLAWIEHRRADGAVGTADWRTID